MANIMLNENLGEVGFDDLIIDCVPQADVVTIQLAASQGILKRGSVVSGTPGSTMTLLAAALAPSVSGTAAESTVTGSVAAVAAYILADDVDTGTSGAVVGVAYRTGHFNRKALTVGSSYTLTDADEEFLREAGILLGDAVDY